MSGLLVGVSFVLQGHIELQLSDEGYFWYGASRTAAGELPIHDFQSSDPNYPSLYSLLRLKSPVREIYFLRRQTETAQAKIISQIEASNTNWAILADAVIDDRDDLRFSNTNKLVWNYLMENFVRVPDSGLSEPIHLYRWVK